MINTNEKFIDIKKSLNNRLIGQDKFIEKLCTYFQKKIESDQRGIIFINGEKDTGKKLSIKCLFEKLKEKNLIKVGVVEQIDLGSYNFNYGYNAFLTDIYEKLKSDSECLIFRNIENATKDILKTLSKISPNSCIKLKDNYVIKNQILVESSEKSYENIKEITCNNKFLVFVSDEKKIDLNKYFSKDYFKMVDAIFYTKSLDENERRSVVHREVLKTIEKIKNDLKLDVIYDINENDNLEKQYGMCHYLQETYVKNDNFGISDYVKSRLYDPIKNLMINEHIGIEERALIYVENNTILCKTDKEVYDLNNYSMPTLEEVKYKLNSIIGMSNLKEFINSIDNNFKVQRIRKRLGLKNSNISLNMIFEGNAGVGKTNAARITYEYLNALGILSTGIFIEASKADFVTENLNDTAKKTMEVVNSALGGVLFIDEAYSLCESEDDKVGKEIIEALLKGIEDNKNDLIVILAGYERDMENFLSINQGLKSRFPNTIAFEDYNPVEMYEIAVNIAKSKGYRIDKSAKEGLIDLFTKNQLIGKSDLGNARFVRNVVENAIMDASKKYLTDNKKQIDLLEKDNFNFKVNAKFNLEEKLKSIIGLDEVKTLIRNQYKLIAAHEKRKAAGVETKLEQNLNMVFAGNPGTGKTSVARLVAEMLNSMGLLKIGQLIETDRSGFVANTTEETAKKTEDKFKEAIGGILFIDEAYTLANDKLGRDAIEVLLKLIEDYSNEVIVILAGYEKEMENFFDVNIGLRSRFPLWTTFQDYNPDELLQMAIKLIEKNGFKLSKNAYISLKNSLIDVYENSDAQSGNGRMVRNYVENLIRNQSIRIAENDISVYEMNLITTRDIEKINEAEHINTYDLEQKLNEVIIAENSKQFIRNQYNLTRVNKKRQRLGMRTEVNRLMNMVFIGEDGTGKKTALKILSEMYYNLGMVKSKNLMELAARDILLMLKDGNKLKDILGESLGRVLYINDFNLLMEEDNNEYILDALLKFIDENKTKVIVALSGDGDKLRCLYAGNSDFSGRFPLWLNFSPYNLEQLIGVARYSLKEKGFVISKGTDELLKSIMDEFSNNKKLSIKNGIMVKKFIDTLIRVQSIRVSTGSLSAKEINTIIDKDILLTKERFIERNIFACELCKDGAGLGILCRRKNNDRVIANRRNVRAFTIEDKKDIKPLFVADIEKHELTEEKRMKKSEVEKERKIIEPQTKLNSELLKEELLNIKNLFDLNVIDESEFKVLKAKIISKY